MRNTNNRRHSVQRKTTNVSNISKAKSSSGLSKVTLSTVGGGGAGRVNVTRSPGHPLSGVTGFLSDVYRGASDTVHSYNLLDDRERANRDKAAQDVLIEGAIGGKLDQSFQELGRRAHDEPGRLVGEIAVEAGINIATLGMGAAVKGAILGAKVGKTLTKVGKAEMVLTKVNKAGTAGEVLTKTGNRFVKNKVRLHRHDKNYIITDVGDEVKPGKVSQALDFGLAGQASKLEHRALFAAAKGTRGKSRQFVVPQVAGGAGPFGGFATKFDQLAATSTKSPTDTLTHIERPKKFNDRFRTLTEKSEKTLVELDLPKSGTASSNDIINTESAGVLFNQIIIRGINTGKTDEAIVKNIDSLKDSIKTKESLTGVFYGREKNIVLPKAPREELGSVIPDLPGNIVTRGGEKKYRAFGKGKPDVPLRKISDMDKTLLRLETQDVKTKDEFISNFGFAWKRYVSKNHQNTDRYYNVDEMKSRLKYDIAQEQKTISISITSDTIRSAKFRKHELGNYAKTEHGQNIGPTADTPETRIASHTPDWAGLKNIKIIEYEKFKSDYSRWSKSWAAKELKRSGVDVPESAFGYLQKTGLGASDALNSAAFTNLKNERFLAPGRLRGALYTEWKRDKGQKALTASKRFLKGETGSTGSSGVEDVVDSKKYLSKFGMGEGDFRMQREIIRQEQDLGFTNPKTTQDIFDRTVGITGKDYEGRLNRARKNIPKTISPGKSLDIDINTNLFPVEPAGMEQIISNVRETKSIGKKGRLPIRLPIEYPWDKKPVSQTKRIRMVKKTKPKNPIIDSQSEIERNLRIFRDLGIKTEDVNRRAGLFKLGRKFKRKSMFEI